MKKLFWDAVAILAPGNRQARRARNAADQRKASVIASDVDDGDRRCLQGQASRPSSQSTTPSRTLARSGSLWTSWNKLA